MRVTNIAAGRAVAEETRCGTPLEMQLAALDADVPLRDVQVAARHADPCTTTVYDRRRQNIDKRAACVVVASVAGG